jgi:hypothetical protein
MADPSVELHKMLPAQDTLPELHLAFVAPDQLLVQLQPILDKIWKATGDRRKLYLT